MRERTRQAAVTHTATMLVHLHDLLPVVLRLFAAHRPASHDHADALLFLGEARHLRAAVSRPFTAAEPRSSGDGC